MGLILELRDSRGNSTWHRLESLPLTLGRALSNDIIVDDPYADAHHVRILMDESGEVAVEDMGSVNGVHAGGSRTTGRMIARPGLDVRMGRTTLRFRDVNEVVPPALVESAPTSGYSRRLETKLGRSVVIALMLMSIAVVTWLGNTERSSAGDVSSAIFAGGGMAFLWAGMWAVLARGADRRFHLLGHMTVISLAIVVVLAVNAVNEWLTFLFPDNTIVSGVYVVVTVAVFAAVVAGHMSVANLLTPKRRWRGGLIAAGTVLALGSVSELLEDEEFSDVPVFEGQLKPLSASVVPTSTVAEFLGEIEKAKEKADRAVERE